MSIDGASDPVVRLGIFHRQQPHDHIRPQRNSHLWPTPRHHDRLINSETMSQHGCYLGWHRTESNGLPAASRSSLPCDPKKPPRSDVCNYWVFGGAPGSTAATPSGLILNAKKVNGSLPGFPHWWTRLNGS